MPNKSRRTRPIPSGPAPGVAVPQRIQAPQPPANQDPRAIFTSVREYLAPLLQELEDVRGHPLIAFYLSDHAAMADEQIQHLYEHLLRVGKQEHIDLWISSRGGATETPWKIVSIIREFCNRFSVLIPYRANSSATLVSLGADEIVMTEIAELGPIDPSRRHPLLPREELPDGEREQIPISVQDLRHVLSFLKRELGETMTPEAGATIYTALFEKVHPLAIGALEQSWALARQIAERVLSTHMDEKTEGAKIKEITEQLSDNYKSHLYQINRREARDLGLKAVDASAAEAQAMWLLFKAYSSLEITAQLQAGRETMNMIRIGDIDSSQGCTIGWGIAKQTAPDKIVGARWESQWADALPGADPDPESPPTLPAE